jgi:hypothetical protein
MRTHGHAMLYQVPLLPDTDTPTFHTLTREPNHGEIKFDLVTVGKLQNLFDKIICIRFFAQRLAPCLPI